MIAPEDFIAIHEQDPWRYRTELRNSVQSRPDKVWEIKRVTLRRNLRASAVAILYRARALTGV